MIFLFKQVIFRFHVSFRGCIFNPLVIGLISILFHYKWCTSDAGVVDIGLLSFLQTCQRYKLLKSLALANTTVWLFLSRGL